ncbi:ATP-binding cassette (ABC) Superfamily [Phytophthora palmivora]|uniref:ATP-binding cassette (ABC) Superfamily n=1 Tax=Phytophthora palmivora TaxID=4796 RepID=A0A2P4X1W3_9STRA|nr:ATP-binding cassette (ABC) Superfamily [Phytophthora palmivora]
MFLEHLKTPRGLNHGRTSRGAYERALVQVEPLFVKNIEAAWCVLLAPHRIPLKEFTSLRKKPEDRGGLFPVWGPRIQTKAEDLFWRWVSLKNFTVQELIELREVRLLSYVLDHPDLRIDLSPAQDERGYGSVNTGTVHRKAAKKPRTTYAPAVADPKSQRHSGSQPGAGLPAPTSSVTRGNPATSQPVGASQTAAALGRPATLGSGARCSDQGGQEELSHAFEYEAPSQPYPSGPPTSGRGSMGPLLCDEVRQHRDHVYAIEIALGLGPGGQAAAQAGKPGTLEVLRQDLDALGRETHELHGRIDRRAPAATLKELRRGLETLSHEVHGRMPSYEPQGYSYHSAYGYSSYPSSSHSVPSYPSYDSRGYQPVYQSQASTPAAPVVQRAQPCFEETQRIVIPLKTPHVERRVNGIRRAMSGKDREASNEAVLPLVAPYGANEVYR